MIHRPYERAVDRKADKLFYASAPWRKLRSLVLAEQPLCADCRRRGELRPAAHVHHKIERKDRPDLALDHDNLEALCQPCHNRRRRDAR